MDSYPPLGISPAPPSTPPSSPPPSPSTNCETPMFKLNVGTNRKIGQPDYGSAGASCNLEVELDTALFHDLDGLHHVIKRAYAACNQAVNDELTRLSAPSSGSNGHQHHQHHHLHHDHYQPHPATAPIHEVLVSPVIHGARFSTRYWKNATEPTSSGSSGARTAQRRCSSKRSVPPSWQSRPKSARPDGSRRPTPTPYRWCSSIPTGTASR